MRERSVYSAEKKGVYSVADHCTRKLLCILHEPSHLNCQEDGALVGSPRLIQVISYVNVSIERFFRRSRALIADLILSWRLFGIIRTYDSLILPSPVVLANLYTHRLSEVLEISEQDTA